MQLLQSDESQLAHCGFKHIGQGYKVAIQENRSDKHQCFNYPKYQKTHFQTSLFLESDIPFIFHISNLNIFIKSQKQGEHGYS